MTIIEFSTRLNVPIQYAFGVTNTNKGKMKIFINGLKCGIAKDALTRDNTYRLFILVIGRALKLEIMKQMRVREKQKQP